MYSGDRPRQPAYEIKLMLWRVSWALAQDFLFHLLCRQLCRTSVDRQVFSCRRTGGTHRVTVQAFQHLHNFKTELFRMAWTLSLVSVIMCIWFVCDIRRFTYMCSNSFIDGLIDRPRRLLNCSLSFPYQCWQMVLEIRMLGRWKSLRSLWISLSKNAAV